MRKSGLHKQISSIFDGAAQPQSAPTPSRSILQRMADDGSQPDDADVSNAAVEVSAAESAQPSVRPKPAPRRPYKPRLDAKKTVARKKQSLTDQAAAQRQKKMTIMVGVLSVIFIAMIVHTSGGIGSSHAAEIDLEELDETAVTVQPVDLKTWQTPDPLPATMRDPMVTEADDNANAMAAAVVAAPIRLTVNGIVHSHNRPSAIVNDKIVFEGDAVGNATVTRITPTAVEFERDNERWTQQVRQ